MASRKRYVLFMAVYFFALQSSMGEIKNGYASQIVARRESLKALNSILDEHRNVSLPQKNAMKNHINKLVEYISYFELTEELLQQFKIIAPEMYNEIDNIKDNKERVVTVYVKFLPEREIQYSLAGTTNLAFVKNDKNIYTSEYGAGTVSVKIASTIKSLIVLAHEFGHVKYQVPNLARYAEYHTMNYQNRVMNPNYIGHHINDPSGKIALEYENLFRLQYMIFAKNKNQLTGNPSALLQKIRKNLMVKRIAT